MLERTLLGSVVKSVNDASSLTATSDPPESDLVGGEELARYDPISERAVCIVGLLARQRASAKPLYGEDVVVTKNLQSESNSERQRDGIVERIQQQFARMQRHADRHIEHQGTVAQAPVTFVGRRTSGQLARSLAPCSTNCTAVAHVPLSRQCNNFKCCRLRLRPASGLGRDLVEIDRGGVEASTRRESERRRRATNNFDRRQVCSGEIGHRAIAGAQ